jgi:hypothetical protein
LLGAAAALDLPLFDAQGCLPLGPLPVAAEAVEAVAYLVPRRPDQTAYRSVALFAAGGIAGVALAPLRLVILAAPPGLPVPRDVSLDIPVSVVGLAMALVTGLVFGVVPSWEARRTDVAETLGFGAKGSVRGGVSQRFRRMLLLEQ